MKERTTNLRLSDLEHKTNLRLSDLEHKILTLSIVYFDSKRI